jgi:GTP-binding protein
VRLAIAEADALVFVVDARDGLLPQDDAILAELRRSGKPIVAVVNKTDGLDEQAVMAEFFAFGIGATLPLSAAHNRGTDDFLRVLLPLLPADREPAAEAADEDGSIRVAIVGRPNAGKSTLINRLIGEQRLLTGPEAGITRDSISVDWVWGDRKVRLVDTAGLRKKAKVNEKLEKLSTGDTIRSITFAEVVLLVMDATHPFETQDLQIADLAEREGRCVVFVLAKWDLVEDQAATLKGFIEHAERMLPQLRGTPVVALSGETGKGVERLMPAVLKSHRDWSTKVKTRDLNDWLQMAMQRHPPPSVGGKRIKPKYMAQTKARPPTFVLFSSRADQMPEQYRRYLINSLRESFDLPGVPLRITIKSGANPYAEGEAKGHSGKGKREFQRKEREAERIRASRNTVKKSVRLAEAAAAAAGVEFEPGRTEATPTKAAARIAKKAGPTVTRTAKPVEPTTAAPVAEPGKAAVKSVKKLGPKVQKKSATPSYKVGFKAAGGKAVTGKSGFKSSTPRRPVAGARTVRGNKAPPKGR